jgi:RND family efflux transporter MFP subunit
MNHLLPFLRALIPEIFVGASLLLTIGVVAIYLFSSPAKRQRLGELSVAATLVWFVLACVPMPRWNAIRIADRSEFEPATIPIRVFDVEPESRLTMTDSVESPSIGELPSRSTAGTNATSNRAYDSTALNPLDIVLGLFGLGSLFCAVSLFVGRVALYRTEQASIAASDDVKRLYDSIPKRRVARLLISHSNIGPASFGLVRPRILLSQSLCDAIRLSALRHVLLHEQTHVDRRDAVGHVLMNVALPMLYWHPLYWLVRRRIEFSRELLADDRAASQGPKTEYVEEMLRLLRLPDFRLAASMGVVGTFRRRNSFTRRMEMLIQRPHQLEQNAHVKWQILVAALAIVMVIATASLIGARRANGQAPRDDTPNEPAGRDAGVATGTEGLGTAAIESTSGEIDGQEGSASKSSGTSDMVLEHGVVVAYAVQVPASQTGQIQEIAVREGSTVKSGDILAKLDDSASRETLRSIDQEIQRLTISTDNSSEVRKAEANLQALRKQLELLHRANTQLKGSVHTSQIVSLEGQVAVASADMEFAKQSDSIRKLDLEKKRSELAAAQDQQKKFTVVAPVDGTIVEVFHRAGEWVNAGDPVARLIDLSQIQVKAHVLDDRSSILDELPHRDVRILVERKGHTPMELTGKITFISPEVDVNQCRRVLIHCDNQKRDDHWMLLPGSEVDVIVPRASAAESAAIPTDNSRPAVANEAEIESLTELVRAAEATWKRVHALYQAGSDRGSAPNETLARYHLADSKARLAMARGETTSAVTYYEEALRAAEELNRVMAALSEHGVIRLESLVNAQNIRANAKRNLLLAKQKPTK